MSTVRFECAGMSRVDGGMSDNARPVLYDADYTVTLANRAAAGGTGAFTCGG